MKKNSISTIALVGSLVLNGFLIGANLPHMRGSPHHPPLPFDRMEKALVYVDGQYRAEIKELIENHRMNMDHHMMALGNRFSDIKKSLTAPNFNEETLRMVEEGIAKDDHILKGAMLSLMIDIAKVLPDDQRVKFFQSTIPDHPPFVGGKFFPPRHR